MWEVISESTVIRSNPKKSLPSKRYIKYTLGHGYVTKKRDQKERPLERRSEKKLVLYIKKSCLESKYMLARLSHTSSDVKNLLRQVNANTSCICGVNASSKHGTPYE